MTGILGLIPRPKLGLQTPMGSMVSVQKRFWERPGMGGGQLKAGTGLAASRAEERPSGPGDIALTGRVMRGGLQ